MYSADRFAAAAMRSALASNMTPAQRAEAARRDKLRRLMRRAWDIARMAAQTFGGRASAYIAQAMAQAWAEARGECDAFNADATLYRIQARTRRAAPQRATGYRGRHWYAAAAGW